MWREERSCSRLGERERWRCDLYSLSGIMIRGLAVNSVVCLREWEYNHVWRLTVVEGVRMSPSTDHAKRVR